MHPNKIHLTTITTLLRLCEWTVMPMRLCNALAIQQHRLTMALQPYIGCICHVYLDDIVVWSQSIDKHKASVVLILKALQDHKLFCNPKKTCLFALSIFFLGYHISPQGIHTDMSKLNQIQEWPISTNTTQMWGFLGLVPYLAQYVIDIAPHLALLQCLTTKDSKKSFPLWTSTYQIAFDSIKTTVSHNFCLSTIDYLLFPNMSIFVTTNAPDTGTGAILSFGSTWKQSCPVALDFMTFKGVELNYPIHEKELLIIICVLKKWCADLLGIPFMVFTDHCTLESFMTQKDLSHQQSCWLEFLSQYNFVIKYVRGQDNIHPDTLSHLPKIAPHLIPHDGFSWDDDSSVLAISAASPLASSSALAMLGNLLPHTCLDISIDTTVLQEICSGYSQDPWCSKLSEAQWDMKSIHFHDGLWYIHDYLVIPCSGNLHATLFQLAHGVLGHLGLDKFYESLCLSYFWPGMCIELTKLYVLSCVECQWNKLAVEKTGPLYLLPVPDDHFQSLAMDFIGPLPPSSRIRL